MTAPELHRPVHPVRFVTAASLFDGHDASITIMRRILQSQGAEVVHLGHNRSVDEVVAAAVAEDVQGIALSSYQGGHVEYFEYLVDRLREEGFGYVKVFGGGGGVIVPEEIERLHRHGVTRIFSPEDGQRLGLARMVNTMIESCDVDLAAEPAALDEVLGGSPSALARLITVLESGTARTDVLDGLRRAASAREVPVLGITGTGGSGKSSLTDELIRRLRLDQEDKVRVAVVAIDPTRRRGGGALLGDRIRMNSIDSPRIFFRSLATRSHDSEVPSCLDDVVAATKAWGADLVIVETPGIGQGDAAIVPHSDVSLYVMTPEFGASSQLEKIDMLDFADAVAINKFERRGAEDARRDVARQLVRNREAFDQQPEDMPVFGTVAARFNDDGVTALYQHLRDRLAEHGLAVGQGALAPVTTKVSSGLSEIVPSSRTRYLAEIVESVRGYHETTAAQVQVARRAQQVAATAELLRAEGHDDATVAALAERTSGELAPESRTLLEEWPAQAAELSGPGRPSHESLAGTLVPKLALPKFADHGELLRWLRSEHLPGHFPFTAGVFPFRRTEEDPARMFAGEGGPARTNRRFHLLSEGQPATRLSTAFDSVTLYGFDPGSGPTSTARSATPACRSRRWTTWRSSSTGSTCATRRPRCR